MIRRRWLLIPVGILLVLAVLAVARTGGQVRHADGSGPLASKGDPGRESFAASQQDGLTAWTYGVPLCLAEGTTPAVITSVAPASTIGLGFSTLGVKIRTFIWTSQTTPMISENGYPPADVSPDTLEAPAGLQVTTGCSPFDLGKPYTELLVGLGVTSPQDDGGGWHGILVRYTIGGAEHELEIANDMFICGRSVADYCRSGPPSPSGS